MKRYPIFLLCFHIGLLFSKAFAYNPPNVWDVLREEFVLNHEVTQPEVQNQLRWLISHPSYLQKLARSEPYMYHIVTQIRKRHLPGELALIPMIESAYDPFAYSGVGAAGLWQLMPGTGTNLGLKQDWWYDGRRSIGPSTDAALNYLTRLHRFFQGNWVLAIAAYDSGEGTVGRAIKNSRSSRFWQLNLPQETRAYVPRLLALAEIIKYPQRYHVNLPAIPHTPYFEEVNIGSQIDLNHAARLAGISYKDLIKLNPGFNRWTTAPHQPFKLLIPTSKVARFNHNLSLMPEEKRISWAKYQVRFGETLNSIAQQHFTTPNLLREVNQLKTAQVKRGQYLLIPTNTKTLATAPPKSTTATTTWLSQGPYKVIHIVQKQDNYALLEKQYGVTTAQIRGWNRLKSNQALTQGQELVIWRTATQHNIYKIKQGDTLLAIAKNHQTSINQLQRLNPTLKTTLLKPGQIIVL